MARSGLKASDIMTKEVVIARPEMTLVEAARLMNRFRIGGLPVVENGRLVGALTERTIMQRVIEADKQPSKVFVKGIMLPVKVIVRPDEDVWTIAEHMAKRDVSRVFVCENGKKDGRLVGIVTNRDVLKYSHETVDLLVEQAKIKGPKLSGQYTAFGKCEDCGDNTHLSYQNNKFVCDECAE